MCIFGCNGAANPPATKSILSHLIDIAASAIPDRSTPTSQTSTQSTDMSAKITKQHMSKKFLICNNQNRLRKVHLSVRRMFARRKAELLRGRLFNDLTWTCVAREHLPRRHVVCSSSSCCRAEGGTGMLTHRLMKNMETWTRCCEDGRRDRSSKLN